MFDRYSNRRIGDDVERTLWYQVGLDDPDLNHGDSFRPHYNFNEFGANRVPARTLAYPGEPANLVSSLTRTGMHAPVIDLDVPARLLPSKTPGHSHLYIDVEIAWKDYMNILGALSSYGAMLVEPNYVAAAREAKQTFVRLDPSSRPERV